MHLQKILNNPKLINELGKNIQLPVSMSYIAELIEVEVQKLLDNL